MESVGDTPSCIRIFGFDILIQDTSSTAQEPPRILQEFDLFSSKKRESVSSSESRRTLRFSPSPSLNFTDSAFSRISGGDDFSGESFEDDAVGPFKVSTKLCLVDETWNWNPKNRERKRTNDTEISCVPRNLEEEGEGEGEEEEEEEAEAWRDGVSTKLTLFTDPWKIKKVLKESDIRNLCRLILPIKFIHSHILRYLPLADNININSSEGLSVSVLDHDTRTSHQLCLKRWESSKSYVLIGGWRKDFVVRRNLKERDKIGLFWDRFSSNFHFRVLSRAVENPN